MSKVKNEKNIGLISPWVDYYRQVQALFQEDPEVEVSFDEGSNIIKVYVQNDIKADAISKILPEEKTFGNVTVSISVIPANEHPDDPVVLMQHAFNGNPAFEGVQTFDTPFGTMNFAIFAKEVVQYYNDDMFNIFGLKSTLYEDIARNVLDLKDMKYCTSDE